jgi:hypothetical protein
VVSAEAANQARGVARLYRLPGDDRGFGAFVSGTEQRIGEEFDDAALGRLYQTVVVAMLDNNPSRADLGAAPHNAGHRICTTENLQLFGHGVDADGYTAYSTGVMAATLVGGARVGENEDVIEPPNEMRLPLMRPQMDGVYASALYQVLTDLDDDGPDLPGAIRWLEVSWINARAVGVEARVLALRAGFDVLFGGAATREVRGGLSELLDEADAPRTRRRWIDHGNEREGHLTDLEWWFQSFALHGRPRGTRVRGRHPAHLARRAAAPPRDQEDRRRQGPRASAARPF